MIFLTTTAIEIDEELLNRCLVLTVDEDREQTRAIHRLQRERQTLEGLLARQRAAEHVLKVHRNAQRLLRPLLVVNPYAAAAHLPRRPHAHAARPREVPDPDPHDRAAAPAPAAGARPSSTAAQVVRVHRGDARRHRGRQPPGAPGARPRLDELPPQTRRLLLALDAMVAAGMRGAAGRRAAIPLQPPRGARAHRLERHPGARPPGAARAELEYVLVHRGGRGQSFVYELVYDGQGQDGQPFLSGLIDVERSASWLRRASVRASSRPFGASRAPSRARRSRVGVGSRVRVRPATGLTESRSSRAEPPKTHIGSRLPRRPRRSPSGNGSRGA